MIFQRVAGRSEAAQDAPVAVLKSVHLSSGRGGACGQLTESSESRYPKSADTFAYMP
jgi:hypothetical protein